MNRSEGARYFNPEYPPLRVLEGGKSREGAARKESMTESERKIHEGLIEIAKTAGLQTARQTLGLLAEQGVSTDRLQAIEIYKKDAGRLEFQQEFLDSLERNGELEIKEDGTMVVDLEKVTHKNVRARFDGGLAKRFPQFFGNSKMQMLQHVFYGLKVVSREDWEAGKRESKDLIYSPSSLDEALDIESIKKSKFYLSPNDFIKSGTDIYSNMMEPIPMDDVTLALLIYHPDYGDGYRNEQGKLMVYYPSRNKYVPISSSFFTDEMKRYTYSRHGSTMHSPRTFLKERASAIQEAGLLQASDFRRQMLHNKASDEYFNRKLNKNGTVMLKGVFYYVGRHFADKQARVLEIDESRAAVCVPDKSGKLQAVQVFDLYERDDPRLTKKYNFGKMQVPGVRKQEMNMYAFDDIEAGE